MKGRFSKYINPILLLIDLLIINLVSHFFFKSQEINKYFYVFISVFWIVSSLSTGFYRIYRFTGVLKLLRLSIVQLIVFTLGYFSFFGIFKEGVVINSQFSIINYISLAIFIIKIGIYSTLKLYRTLGNNYRTVVFVEIDDTAKRLLNIFLSKKYLGYKTLGFFSNIQSKNEKYLGNLNQLENYVLSNDIDEIYATQSKLNKAFLRKLNKFSSRNNIKFKLIPNSQELYSKNKNEEFYDDTFKVLAVKSLPFQTKENKVVKRAFDILFSFIVILLIMTWLIPILWLVIRLESKGPLFFKQEREGLNGEKFLCYKFRSMRKNNLANKIHASKNDNRVTNVGKFIRKTSIDELPQFFNVLLGDMSVVGPRPHMNVHSEKFEKEVVDYIKRYEVKPGITGLAQVSGYRGEIKRKSDIENRVRLDIFYIENWSFLFDIKIIIKTVLNVFKGEEKAY